MIYTVWTKMDDRCTETLIHISKHQKNILLVKKLYKKLNFVDVERKMN